MRLYWLVHKYNGQRRVFIQQASSMVSARLQARTMGHEGEYLEGHELQAKTARRLPLDMIGRVLSRDEAAGLLERLG